MSTGIEKQVGVADVYADALFELATERKVVQEVHDELQQLAQMLRQNPDILAFATSDALDDARRVATLESTLRGKLSDLVLNTILVLNRKGRHGLLPALLDRYEKRFYDASGQVRVRARSAVELGPAEREAVTRTAAQLTGRTPQIDFFVEPELLGGLIVEFEDQRFDNSVRRQLKVARDRLRERSELGLSVTVS